MLYTSRCNFRCPFCHNRRLVFSEDIEPIPEEKLLKILSSRRGFIDGVVITGGEPTVHAGLVGMAAAIKKLGLAVKLDTNGYNPAMLKVLLAERLVNFVAMDIKTSWHKYQQASGIAIDTRRLIESINLIKNAQIDYEFRTTCVPLLVDGNDIEKISRLVGNSGRYTLQQFQPQNTLDPDYSMITPYPRETLVSFMEIASQHTRSCRLVGI